MKTPKRQRRLEPKQGNQEQLDRIKELKRQGRIRPEGAEERRLYLEAREAGPEALEAYQQSKKERRQEQRLAHRARMERGNHAG